MRTGTVFDIQHYCLHDGPGIRTVVFLKGCPLKCAWCHNPESQKKNPEMGYLREKCTQCMKCASICPNGAIRFIERSKSPFAPLCPPLPKGEDKGSVLSVPKRELIKLPPLAKGGKGGFKSIFRIFGKSQSVFSITRDSSLCRVCGGCATVCETGATQVIGKLVDAEDVAGTVLLDRPFYENSGGGVTLSGGEPTMQKGFLLELLGRFKEAGVHTAIETCGYFESALVDELVRLNDLFLFDLKQIDSARHREFTGKDNAVILENFRRVLEKAGQARVIPRVPLIPGFNTDDASVVMMANFLTKAGYSGVINLMQYNSLYKTKFEKINRGTEYRDFGRPGEDISEQIGRMFEKNGFKAVCQN